MSRAHTKARVRCWYQQPPLLAQRERYLKELPHGHPREGSSSCRELMKGESDTSAFAPLACSRWRIADCTHGASSSHDPHTSMKAATRYRSIGESCQATPLSQIAQPAQLGQPHLVLNNASGVVLQPALHHSSHARQDVW
jgi:hypothetical protein